MAAADIIDGKAFAAGLRGRIAEAVGDLKANHGLNPGLAVVLVGEDPASRVYVRNKAKQTQEVGMASFEHRLSAETGQDELLALVAQLNADPCRQRHPGPAAPAAADRRPGRARRHRPGQGRRRLSRHQRRAPHDRGRPAPGALHAARLHPPPEGPPGRAQGLERGHRRAFQHRRQALGPAALERALHGHHRPFAGPAICRPSAAPPTSWWPPSAGRRWCAATGSGPAPR